MCQRTTVTRLANIRTTPELPKSATMGGKMGGTAFKASRELGLPRVPASWLLAFLLAAGSTPALAQQETPACAPVIARVVSLQGTVEVQRAGAATSTLQSARVTGCGRRLPVERRFSCSPKRLCAWTRTRHSRSSSRLTRSRSSFRLTKCLVSRAVSKPVARATSSHGFRRSSR